MPMTGETARLGRIGRAMTGIADPSGKGHDALLMGVDKQVKLVLKTEFQGSFGPDGNTWVQTKRGKDALVSNKLPNVFISRIENGVLRFIGRGKRDMIEALSSGHVFPARGVSALQHYLSFNSKNKLVRESRLFNKKGDLRKGARQVFAKAHTVSKRVLPPRPIVPAGGELPSRWDAAVRAGLTIGFAQQIEKALQ